MSPIRSFVPTLTVGVLAAAFGCGQVASADAPGSEQDAAVHDAALDRDDGDAPEEIPYEPPPACLLPAIGCAPNEFCWDETCRGGVCWAKPRSCGGGRMGDGVCGCDGVIYPNMCAAWEGGTFPSPTPDCAPMPPGRFACGRSFCDPRVDFCMRYQGGIGDREVCTPLTDSCRATPDCTCIVQEYPGGCYGCELVETSAGLVAMPTCEGPIE
jgi:hypothetical protein